MKFKHTLVLATLALMLMGCQNHSNQQMIEIKETLPDVSIRDMNRDLQSVKELVGQHRLTIIDFWASWCGPCVDEMPKMKAIFDKYQKQDLNMIGISLDSNFESWQSTVDGMKLNWTHLSELRKWDDTMARTLGIQAIPHTMIVDKQGNILSRGLRGDELEKKVAELLNSTEK